MVHLLPVSKLHWNDCYSLANVALEDCQGMPRQTAWDYILVVFIRLELDFLIDV
jgi:hypothetical protein